MRFDDFPPDRIREDNEQGKSITYLDNATIINACSVLENPERFDIYKLLDLESFCEAFLLFDHVRTLVGSSFACAFSSGYCFPKRHDWRTPVDFAEAVWTAPKETEGTEGTQSSVPTYATDTGKLYSQLIDGGLLRPVVLSAGTVHYGIENISALDSVANALDTKRTTAIMEKLFGEDIPWDYGGKDISWEGARDKKEARREAAWGNLIIGEETGASDSYPVYYFPTEEKKERGPADDDFGWEINNNRRTGRIETFVSQTFFYVVEASLHRKPYLCSSIRVPIVRDMVRQINQQFISVVHGSLGSISQGVRQKIESAIRFLGAGAVEFLYLPVLFAVLRHAKSRHDVISTIMTLREREDVRSYRQWCVSLENAWKNEDLGRVSRAIQELQKLSTQLAGTLAGQSLRGALHHVANVQLLARDRTTGPSEEEIVFNCFNPSLSFVKDVGSYLSLLRENRRLIEKILEHRLTRADATTLEKLQARREELYSPGHIDEPNADITIESMEVTMGDTFKDIQNSIIATRGSIAEGIISIRKEGDGRIAEALEKLDLLINEASDNVLNKENKAAGSDLLNGIVQEAKKPEPNKTVMRSLGESLLGLLTVVKPLAEAGKDAFEIIKSLWT
jgi:hypothetical protein